MEQEQNKYQLLYTDSLIMMIQTEVVYKDMLQNLDMYDTSNYDTDHFLYSAKNTKVLSKMKDEMGGKPFTRDVQGCAV